jgi:hypothetical protein
MKATKAMITVFYNGGCPSCIRDRDTYQRLASPSKSTPISWVDITRQENELHAAGIDPIKAFCSTTYPFCARGPG